MYKRQDKERSEACKILASYNGLSAYGQSKLANILHASELARQLKVRDMFVKFSLFINLGNQKM